MDRDSIDKASMLTMVRDNHSGFLLEMGSQWVSTVRHEGLSWSIGSSPVAYHNAVLPRRIDSGREDEAIRLSIESLRRNRVPGTWHLWSDNDGKELKARLAANDFELAGSEDAMAVRIPEIQNPKTPAGFEMREVSSDDQLRLWVAVLAEGFEAGIAKAEWIGESFRRLEYGPGKSWHHYIGYVNGSPVSTATVYEEVGVAGLYYVFTLPDARGKGYGGMLSARALAAASERGFRFAVLTTPLMGAHLYKELGFKRFGSLNLYEWKFKA